MTNKNIFAHTAPGACCPEYVSINAHAQGGAAITVRSDSEMRVSTARLSDYQLMAMVESILLYLRDADAATLTKHVHVGAVGSATTHAA